MDVDLRRAGEVRAVGLEDKCLGAAAEAGAHDPLARLGEEDLFDKAANIGAIGRRGGAAERIGAEGKGDMGHVAITLGWTVTGMGGPCGICSTDWHIPTLVARTRG